MQKMSNGVQISAEAGINDFRKGMNPLLPASVSGILNCCDSGTPR